MSDKNKVFDTNVNYSDRFVNKFGKRIRLPEFKNMDAQFHPYYKDHIVVLSRVEIPKGYKMTQVFDGNLTRVDFMPQTYQDEFEAAIIKAEAQQVRKNKEEHHDDTEDDDDENDLTSKRTAKDNGLFEETKTKINDDPKDNDIAYEGGDSDIDDDERPLTEGDENNTQSKLNQEKGFFNAFENDHEELKQKSDEDSDNNAKIKPEKEFQRLSEKSKSDIHNKSNSNSPDVDRSRFKDMFYQAQQNLDKLKDSSSRNGSEQDNDLDELASDNGDEPYEKNETESRHESNHLLSSERTPLNQIPSEHSNSKLQNSEAEVAKSDEAISIIKNSSKKLKTSDELFKNVDGSDANKDAETVHPAEEEKQESNIEPEIEQGVYSYNAPTYNNPSLYPNPFSNNDPNSDENKLLNLEERF